MCLKIHHNHVFLCYRYLPNIYTSWAVYNTQIYSIHYSKSSREQKCVNNYYCRYSLENTTPRQPSKSRLHALHSVLSVCISIRTKTTFKYFIIIEYRYTYIYMSGWFRYVHWSMLVIVAVGGATICVHIYKCVI